jgi:hypothetical protein
MRLARMFRVQKSSAAVFSTAQRLKKQGFHQSVIGSAQN